MRAVLTLILTLAVLAACSSEKKAKKQSDDSQPAAVTDADVELASDWVVVYEAYATAMESTPNDCALVATAVLEVNRKNADLIFKGKPRLAELRRDPAVAAFLDKNYKARMGAALDRMAPTLDRCRSDAQVSAALAAGAFERK